MPPRVPAEVLARAIVLEVDLETGAIRNAPDGPASDDASPAGLRGQLRWIGGVGVATQPGWRRVVLQVTRDGATRPPVSPDEVHGLRRPARPAVPLLVPIAMENVPMPGRVLVDDGTTVVVERASAGRIRASEEFDGDGSPGTGAPFAFFDGRPCPPDRERAGCFRYEAMPLGPREIGFDVEPGVRRFRVRLLLVGP